MRAVTSVIYALMASWLIVAALIRLGIQLTHGYALDPIPFISGLLGIGALLLLLFIRSRERANDRR